MVGEPSALPAIIGVVGVGTIASAVVRGLCSPGGLSVPPPRIILSPRGADKAAALAAEYPEIVRVAGSNQEVVDAAECVVVSVLPKQAEAVLRGLAFREGQQVLSFVATVKLAQLQEFVAPAVECAIAMPLPAVAQRRGTTLLTPPRPFARAVFDALGSSVDVEDEAQFKRMQCITGLMGDFYKRQLCAQQWLEAEGVAPATAAAWVGASLATMAADSSKPGPDTFAKLVAEQTPGGLNEMVWRDQEADGSYESLKHSLDALHNRLVTGTVDPGLAPAAKRARVASVPPGTGALKR